MEEVAAALHLVLEAFDPKVVPASIRRMCGHHHDLKIPHHGWALVEGPGKQPLVPPEDPRHPKNKPKDQSTAA